MKQIYFLLIAGLVCFSACKKTDKERPVFTVNSPADSTIFETGQTIAFSANFIDNEDLSQYKIDIHDNFDGHGHDKNLATIWNQILIQNIAGSNFTENRNITVPDSAAAGWYHFLVTCVDVAGNQSQVEFRNIYIRNISDTVAPTVNLTTPVENASYTLGNNLSVDANITDNERVYIVNTRIRRPNSSNNIFFKADTFGTNAVNFNKIIPTTGSTWTTGAYELRFTVFDNYYNKTVREIHFNLN